MWWFNIWHVQRVYTKYIIYFTHTSVIRYTYPNTNTFVQSKKYRVQINETGNWKNKFCFIHPDYMLHATRTCYMYYMVNHMYVCMNV